MGLIKYRVGNESHANTFFANLVSTIASRSGSDVLFRVGGTSLDHALCNAFQVEPVKDIKLQNIAPRVFTIIGPSWFDSFLPLKQLILKYIYQTPLTVGSVQNTITFARKGVEAIGNEEFQAIEIGNEPNIGFHDSTPEKYVTKWLQYAKAVSAHLTKLPAGPIYQGLALAAGATKPWEVSTIFTDGIDKLNNIKSVSHHYYQVFPDCDGSQSNLQGPHYLERTLLNHSFTISAAAGLKSATEFLSKTHPNIPFVLGEIGSGLAGGNKNSTAGRQIESSLGTAIWTFDFHLHCMSIGIAGISNQVGETGWNFAPFNSRPSKDVPTAMRPTWYGIVAATDFVGNNNSLPTRVSSISTPAHSNVTAYAWHCGSDLSKIALLNLELWDEILEPEKMRPNATVQLEGLPANVRAVQVKRLTGPGGLSLSNVIWGGESWTYESDGKAVKTRQDAEVVQVKEGSAKVTVAATEAVVLSLVG